MNKRPDMPHRLLHTMIRVKDLTRSVEFYTCALGMRELRREDYPAGKFTLCFLGFRDERDATVLELTYNYGSRDYSHGTAFGHLAVAVEDIFAACARLKKLGVIVSREPGLMAVCAIDGRCDTIAFAEDPDGYKIELIERA